MQQGEVDVIFGSRCKKREADAKIERAIWPGRLMCFRRLMETPLFGRVGALKILSRDLLEYTSGWWPHRLLKVKGLAFTREDLREFHYDFWEDFLLSNVIKENEARRHEIPLVLARIEYGRSLWCIRVSDQCCTCAVTAILSLTPCAPSALAPATAVSMPTGRWIGL